MNDIVERWNITPDLSISRVLTGLWQIADMEREGRELDPAATARAMAPYVEAGFTTFDMADHYGSAEVIAGLFAREHGHDRVQLFTKWVPKPGPANREDVRTRIYIKNMDYWEAVARVHGRRFRGIRPANTLVSADIIGSEYLVEIEAEALVG